jgi:succinoglycan biosynthesis protein ExoA
MTDDPGQVAARPRVTIGIPALDEANHIGGCLEAIAAQSYPEILEVLVADGGSTDGTREIAGASPGVRVLDNPRRSRPAGLNAAIAAAKGDVFVRVDARTIIAPDYVERCVDALLRSGAAIVGGPMRLKAVSASERGVKAAMTSRLGSGPAQFRREAGEPRFVDTVYLGAYRLDVIRSLGGYDEWFGGNEDAELNFRAQSAGGVYLDPSIRSSYAVREGIAPLWSQYYRYGRNRTRTMLKHPRSVSARQLAVPALLLGLAGPFRKEVAACYAAAVVARVGLEATRDPAAAPTLAAALPVMHAAWGAGFLRSLLDWAAERARRPAGATGS